MAKRYTGLCHYEFCEPRRCCLRRHASWQAARDHAESLAYVGELIVVRDEARAVVYEARKEE